ncbi:hypothetical protein ACIQVN_06725 [Streptomyces cyaneofuscatus]|uniref:hypothetical protein n=1 Tax=Streptomyces cyaneofuscatus TaxID=66883 RepID=UPI0038202A7C
MSGPQPGVRRPQPAARRPSPVQLTLLAISVPVSVLGVALFVAGTVRRQATAHVLEVIEMQRAGARQKKRA